MPSYEKYASIRDRNNLSDYQVSKDTGIATTTLYDWKNGVSRPKVDKLRVLATYLNVSIEDLLD